MEMEVLNNSIFLVALTFIVFLCAKKLQTWSGQLWLNPVFVTIFIIIGVLKFAGIDYETYHSANSVIDFWLKPAIVALGVPMYLQLKNIRKQLLPIMLSQLVGCIAGIVSVVGVAQLMGASKEVIISLAPKSVTTPIAMEVCTQLGGIQSLTVAIVVCVGIFGAMFGFKVLEIGRIYRADSQGISLGTASHAMGISRAMDKGNDYGVFASVGLILNGVLTAILAPYILKLMGI